MVIAYLLHNNQNTDGSYLQVQHNKQLQRNIVRVMLSIFVNFYVSYSAHKKKCTSQPYAITAQKTQTGGYGVAAQNQNESSDIHRCLRTDCWLLGSCYSPHQTSQR